MMKVLVLTAFYPIPDGTHERMFVHVRNQYYKSCGIDVTVLNFDAKENYVIDGIPVITPEEYDKIGSDVSYDIAVSHSANLRNHYRWLKKYERRFRHLVFFFHGHEILYMNKDYPEPYSYMANSKKYRRYLRDCYDWLKLRAWRDYYRKLSYKSDYVFVSNWVHRHFMINTGLDDEALGSRTHIINNSVGEVFEKNDYDVNSGKKYDFITVRSNLDGSKYCIDLVVMCALADPGSTFLVIGKGEYFEHNSLPANMTLINNTLSHADIMEYINESKCALMPTRQDTQGVMTCELATYGIPVITSDIEVCHEFFEDIPNVRMIDDNDLTGSIKTISSELFENCPYTKTEQFFKDNTIAREVSLFEEILRRPAV